MTKEIIDKFSQLDLEVRSTPSPYVSTDDRVARDSFNLQLNSFYMTDFDYTTVDVVDKIEPDGFEVYCKDALTGEKLVYPRTDYTLFSVKNKILIGFHNYKKFTPKTYMYTEYKSSVELIQASLFENMQSFFHTGKDHSWGSFAFFGSRIVKAADINPTRERCDLNDYGPIFWNNEGNLVEIQSADSQFSEKVDIAKFEDFKFVMSVPSEGHIVYLRLRPINGTILSDNYNNESVVPAVTRTIFELIKLIDEWASVTEEPWNNTQEIAIKAKRFLDGLAIPEQVRSAVRSLQTDMQVYRYLLGQDNARQRPPVEGIALMPDSVYDWLKRQFCYRSFQNLVFYHPLFA